jgi:hypothetical protein
MTISITIINIYSIAASALFLAHAAQPCVK